MLSWLYNSLSSNSAAVACCAPPPRGGAAAHYQRSEVFWRFTATYHDSLFFLCWSAGKDRDFALCKITRRLVVSIWNFIMPSHTRIKLNLCKPALYKACVFPFLPTCPFQFQPRCMTEASTYVVAREIINDLEISLSLDQFLPSDIYKK